jgi:hypothetical protein
MLVSSVPLSLTHSSGRAPRCAMIAVSSRAARAPDNDVSATRQRHSRAKSSTTTRMRNRRPSVSVSAAKSSDQRWSGHVVQHLGHILTEPGHPATTVGAGAGAVVGRLMHDFLAWEMLGKRIALRPVSVRGGWWLGINCLGAGGVFGRAGFQFLELELELLDLAADPFGGPAKLHATQLGDLEPQLLDLQRLRPWRATCLYLPRPRATQPGSNRNR